MWWMVWCITMCMGRGWEWLGQKKTGFRPFIAHGKTIKFMRAFVQMQPLLLLQQQLLQWLLLLLLHHGDVLCVLLHVLRVLLHVLLWLHLVVVVVVVVLLLLLRLLLCLPRPLHLWL